MQQHKASIQEEPAEAENMYASGSSSEEEKVAADAENMYASGSSSEEEQPAEDNNTSTAGAGAGAGADTGAGGLFSSLLTSTSALTGGVVHKLSISAQLAVHKMSLSAEEEPADAENMYASGLSSEEEKVAADAENMYASGSSSEEEQPAGDNNTSTASGLLLDDIGASGLLTSVSSLLTSTSAFTEATVNLAKNTLFSDTLDTALLDHPVTEDNFYGSGDSSEDDESGDESGAQAGEGSVGLSGALSAVHTMKNKRGSLTLGENAASLVALNEGAETLTPSLFAAEGGQEETEVEEAETKESKKQKKARMKEQLKERKEQLKERKARKKKELKELKEKRKQAVVFEPAPRVSVAQSVVGITTGVSSHLQDTIEHPSFRKLLSIVTVVSVIAAVGLGLFAGVTRWVLLGWVALGLISLAPFLVTVAVISRAIYKFFSMPVAVFLLCIFIGAGIVLGVVAGVTDNESVGMIGLGLISSTLLLAIPPTMDALSAMTPRMQRCVYSGAESINWWSVTHWVIMAHFLSSCIFTLEHRTLGRIIPLLTMLPYLVLWIVSVKSARRFYMKHFSCASYTAAKRQAAKSKSKETGAKSELKAGVRKSESSDESGAGAGEGTGTAATEGVIAEGSAGEEEPEMDELRVSSICVDDKKAAAADGSAGAGDESEEGGEKKKKMRKRLFGCCSRKAKAKGAALEWHKTSTSGGDLKGATGELPATPRTQSRMFGVDRVSIKNVETTQHNPTMAGGTTRKDTMDLDDDTLAEEDVDSNTPPEDIDTDSIEMTELRRVSSTTSVKNPMTQMEEGEEDDAGKEIEEGEQKQEEEGGSDKEDKDTSKSDAPTLQTNYEFTLAARPVDDADDGAKTTKHKTKRKRQCCGCSGGSFLPSCLSCTCGPTAQTLHTVWFGVLWFLFGLPMLVLLDAALLFVDPLRSGQAELMEGAEIPYRRLRITNALFFQFLPHVMLLSGLWEKRREEQEEAFDIDFLARNSTAATEELDAGEYRSLMWLVFLISLGGLIFCIKVLTDSFSRAYFTSRVANLFAAGKGHKGSYPIQILLYCMLGPLLVGGRLLYCAVAYYMLWDFGEHGVDPFWLEMTQDFCQKVRIYLQLIYRMEQLRDDDSTEVKHEGVLHTTKGEDVELVELRERYRQWHASPHSGVSKFNVVMTLLFFLQHVALVTSIRPVCAEACVDTISWLHWFIDPENIGGWFDSSAEWFHTAMVLIVQPCAASWVLVHLAHFASHPDARDKWISKQEAFYDFSMRLVSPAIVMALVLIVLGVANRQLTSDLIGVKLHDLIVNWTWFLFGIVTAALAVYISVKAAKRFFWLRCVRMYPMEPKNDPEMIRAKNLFWKRTLLMEGACCIVLFELAYIPAVAALLSKSYDNNSRALRYFSMATVAIYTLGPIIALMRVTFFYMPFENDADKYNERVQKMVDRLDKVFSHTDADHDGVIDKVFSSINDARYFLESVAARVVFSPYGRTGMFMRVLMMFESLAYVVAVTARKAGGESSLLKIKDFDLLNADAASTYIHPSESAESRSLWSCAAISLFGLVLTTLLGPTRHPMESGFDMITRIAKFVLIFTALGIESGEVRVPFATVVVTVVFAAVLVSFGIASGVWWLRKWLWNEILIATLAHLGHTVGESILSRFVLLPCIGRFGKLSLPREGLGDVGAQGIHILLEHKVPIVFMFSSDANCFSKHGLGTIVDGLRENDGPSVLVFKRRSSSKDQTDRDDVNELEKKCEEGWECQTVGKPTHFLLKSRRSGLAMPVPHFKGIESSDGSSGVPPRKIDLSGVQLAYDDCMLVATLLRRNTVVERCKLHEYGLPVQHLRGATGATMLNFHDKKLEEQDLLVVSELLKINKITVELNLQGNHISESAAKALAEMLQSNQVLKVLRFGQRQYKLASLEDKMHDFDFGIDVQKELRRLQVRHQRKASRFSRKASVADGISNQTEDFVEGALNMVEMAMSSHDPTKSTDGFHLLKEYSSPVEVSRRKASVHKDEDEEENVTVSNLERVRSRSRGMSNAAAATREIATARVDDGAATAVKHRMRKYSTTAADDADDAAVVATVEEEDALPVMRLKRTNSIDAYTAAAAGKGPKKNAGWLTTDLGSTVAQMKHLMSPQVASLAKTAQLQRSMYLQSIDTPISTQPNKQTSASDKQTCASAPGAAAAAATQPQPQSFTPPLTFSLACLEVSTTLPHSTYSLTHSHIHSLSHSLSHSLTHSLTHSPTHSNADGKEAISEKPRWYRCSRKRPFTTRVNGA
jgi:hypothetical protein